MFPEKKEFFLSDGKHLAGILTAPRNPVLPVVIVCHGWSRSKDGPKYKTLSADLDRANIASFRFDFYGHGESDGKLHEFNHWVGEGNLASAVRFVQSLGYPSERIGITGSSDGAQIAVKYAGTDPSIGALVLRAPTFDHKAQERARSVKTPTRVVCGSRDEYVPLLHARDFFEMFSCEKDFQVVEGADHACAQPDQQSRVSSLTVGWFDRWLKKKPELLQ